MRGGVLQRPTLVLNRHWQPVHVAPVARALVMVWNEAACVIDPDDFQLYTWSDWAKLAPREGEPFIRTVRFRLRLPEVLALTRHDRARHQTVTFSRRNLFKRDHSTCQYCGAQPGTSELSIDHLIPRSQGGKTTWENCALACVACNARKANRTPEQAGMRLRRSPVRPAWKPLYDATGIRIASWSRFLSDAYWNVPLQNSM
jgi:5-methylcytosine-specific restriction endonuclease McrA